MLWNKLKEFFKETYVDFYSQSAQSGGESTKEEEMSEELTGRLEILEGEERITQIGGAELAIHLTNKRLVYTAVVKKGRETGAAMIRDVDSATIRTTRPSLVLIIFGVLIVIGSIIGAKDLGRYWILALFLGAVMVALFFLLKKRVVQFTIAGMNWLVLSTRKLGSEETIVAFINKFFETKDKVSFTE